MKILAYHGKSFVSKLIRWQTRSEYSHIAVELDDGSVIEAWAKGGVRHVLNAFDKHKKGTKIDVFSIWPKSYDAQAVEKFLRRQVGKKYDFVSVARFVSRRDVVADDKWFCSELAETAFIAGGLPLLRGSPSRHSPRDTSLSPHLRYETTISS